MARASITRSPERTRERILAAALAEFSARGFSGARVDAIARRARINKRMLYHYFGNKEQLYREVLGRKMAAKAEVRDTLPNHLPDALVHMFEAMCSDPEWLRLMEWEALGLGEGEIIGEEERRQAISQAVVRIRARQNEGLLSPELETELLFVMLMALAAFPVAFPQVARLVTGHGPTAPSFRRRWAKFLRTIGEHLAPRAREKGSAA